MKDIKQMVTQDIINLMIDKVLSPREEAILSVLTNSWSDRPVTQKEIAESFQWKKANPEGHEDTHIDTITRKVRKAVHNLRVTHRLPILHNNEGHFLPSCEQDIQDFITRLELEAKGRAASTMNTYRVMKDIVGVSSNLFEELDSIGSQIVEIV